jgi:hypothetical protein
LEGVYGKKMRTLKRWVAIGEAAGEPAPLDRPAEMVGWWERRMTCRVPEEIWKAAGPLVKMEVKKAVKTVPEVPAEDPADEEVVIPEGRGVEAELERLENLAARLSVTAHEPGQAKNYTAAVSQMSILTKRLREEAEKMRRLIQRDEAERAIHEFHGPIEREMRAMVNEMGRILGVEVSPPVLGAWNKALDDVFSRMGAEVLT